jgi:hypothetical protein
MESRRPTMSCRDERRQRCRLAAELSVLQTERERAMTATRLA